MEENYKSFGTFLRENRKNLGPIEIKCLAGRGKDKAYIEFKDFGVTFFVNGSYVKNNKTPALIPGTEEG